VVVETVLACFGVLVAVVWLAWCVAVFFVAAWWTTGALTTLCARLGIDAAAAGATTLSCCEPVALEPGANWGAWTVAAGLVTAPMANAPPNATATRLAASTARPRAAGWSNPSS
jgi:hypothetical protein